MFQDDQIEAYISRSMLVNIVWAFSGDSKWKSRQQLSDFMRQSSTLSLPPNTAVISGFKSFDQIIELFYSAFHDFTVVAKTENFIFIYMNFNRRAITFIRKIFR